MANLTEIIPDDNFQLIRDRIAEIIIDEFEGQKVLIGPDYDPIFDSKIFTERFIPFDQNEGSMVTIWLGNGDYGNKDVRQVDGTYTFNIDCYAASSGDAENRSDAKSGFSVHTLAAKIRFILSSPVYKTLGFTPGFIERISFTGFRVTPPEDNKDARNVRLLALTFDVRAGECTEEQKAILLDESNTTVSIGTSEQGFVYGRKTLPAPTNLIASPGSVNLDWTLNTVDEDNVLLEKSTDGVNFTQIASLPQGTITYTDSDVTDEFFYSYQVRVVKGNDFSGYSNIVFAVEDPCFPNEFDCTELNDPDTGLTTTQKNQTNDINPPSTGDTFVNNFNADSFFRAGRNFFWFIINCFNRWFNNRRYTSFDNGSYFQNTNPFTYGQGGLRNADGTEVPNTGTVTLAMAHFGDVIEDNLLNRFITVFSGQRTLSGFNGWTDIASVVVLAGKDPGDWRVTNRNEAMLLNNQDSVRNLGGPFKHLPFNIDDEVWTNTSWATNICYYITEDGVLTQFFGFADTQEFNAILIADK